MNPITEKALKWCGIFEKKLRPIGWHVALTGSALNGRDNGEPPADIDIIFYPNNDDGLHDEHISQLFEALGIADKVHQLVGNDYAREVWRCRAKDGTQIDFWQL